MKINVLISVVKAISAWLHGEGSAHFRTYTYPRIRKFTRRFVNLGLYEQFDRLYRIVDDTYYNGIQPENVIDPEIISAMEQIADKEEAVTSSYTLPKFKDIKSKLMIWKSLEQGNTYRCGTFTMNNMLRTAMLLVGLKPDLEVTAIDPLYIDTKAGPGKEGTVMLKAFKYLSEKGYPSPSWAPRMTNHNTELDTLEKSTTIKNSKYFRTIKPTGNVKTVYKFDDAVELDRTLPSNWLMQVSISFCKSLKYFGQDVPFLEKVNGKYDLTRTGGHSIHGVRGSFSLHEDGEPGFLIIDSAYRSYEDGDRFLKAKLFQYSLLSVSFVEFPITGEVSQEILQPEPQIVTPPTTTDTDFNILSTQDINQGDSGEAVKALQRYLISAGCIIPSGVTGSFRTETRTALKQWQDLVFGPKYEGTTWGKLSRDKYIELHS